MRFHQQLMIDMLQEAGYQVGLGQGPGGVHAAMARDGRGQTWIAVACSGLEALTAVAQMLATTNSRASVAEEVFAACWPGESRGRRA